MKQPIPGAGLQADAPRLLLDDPDTRIEWHLCGPEPAATLALTFDPLMVLWPRPAFGEAFVRRQGCDVIAVRRKREHFYQPLSRRAFLDAVMPALQGRSRVIAYGSSLGAYAALYYAHDLDALVLAPSPRVSVHPVHGDKGWQAKVPWQHEPFDPGHPARCEAWIAYDPRDAKDRRFVEQDLVPQFPKSRLLAVPYAGHPTTQLQSELGHLQDWVKAALRGDPMPDLPRRTLRSRSATYWQALGEHAMRRNRPALSARFLQESLTLRPRNADALRTQGELALRLGDAAAAAVALKAALEIDPADRWAQHLLSRCEAPAAAACVPAAPGPAVPAPLRSVAAAPAHQEGPLTRLRHWLGRALGR